MNLRQNKIFNIIVKSPKITVKELSKLLSVSEVTIRKDLSSLEEERLIKRIHGAAEISSDSIESKILSKYEEKLRIAKEGIKFVDNGDTILIEAGSTNALLAKQISEARNVHIITNSLYIAENLKLKENVKITLIGGELQKEGDALVGPVAKACLNEVIVDKAFIGMDGFSKELGFCCSDFFRAEIAKEMCSKANKVIVLGEASKFENVGVTLTAKFNEVYTVITDTKISKENMNILKENKVRTLVV
ncbi:DeoR/GlpR family transcriptional regulator of sugar metabolism [Clostridium acetobutylicum]|uniref:Lactose phosphotransferase system repressor n=1 Tax=Clostridium acetobutylicum (strain ATCC 824 / DSM 792 / JCM 1419 / IAM 19013 / LMG 5710 / NBRC 13948 / NRRL B-527 / VKM B-1787 / 2291 / W) TaxID=272562 RepID=Q97J56_CLOAB|nr:MULTISPECIES: DeoR/GlpR family DNA-binding transcription regulator [Clostridium]AAK79398.1 Transcriptional regulators of sugar metabolism (deoR family) [Clostridium acetobutylicum ATCC 824]ADZ20483.1 Transcriptional regulators of sugar metabolism (deoR family) [Clostridium acetobutylicum EA 2018]AEI33919.1 sugar metabolism transcriptional regulator [Clostridium acetobutylicum DSM 1731]AWV81353.1 DeoR/GlpR transcriptional regulator [Clostridium acetobutylicum]MBC2392987.1 DeoR/GlpR transcrip